MTKHKAIVLDKFESDVKCPICKGVTVHHVEKIDEVGNGKFIAYYTECDICKQIEDYSVSDFKQNVINNH